MPVGAFDEVTLGYPRNVGTQTPGNTLSKEARKSMSMESEFEPLPAQPEATPPAPVTPEPVPQAEVKVEFEGQVFKGANWEEVAKKLATAQENATKTIRELRRKEPDKKNPYVFEELKVKPITAAESLVLSDMRDTDPAAYYKRLQEADENWISTQNRIRKMENELKAGQDAQQFIADHAKDYDPTPANSDKINKLLAKEGLPPTKANFEWALQELGDQVKPQTLAPVPPPVTPAPALSSPPPPPVSLSDRSGQRPGEELSLGGVDVSDLVNQINSGDLGKAKAAIQQAFAKARAGQR